MRANGSVLVWLLLAAASAAAQCGAPPRVVVDGALRRQWLVERDCAHPERPAHLIEVPWSGEAAKQKMRPALRTAAATGIKAPPRAVRPPLVRPGMQVMVVRQEALAEVRLKGMALGGGAAGSMVRVKAGLSTTALCGVVRGPALVELVPEAGRRGCGS